ncbi:hypothetical protein [Pelagerythrobacter aerophilus]|uniref:Helix-turn-helix domain-containing protein n=1 Tax=Pelagerythrobacter aerophilus TaxID=2306995 RepID=A0A418NH23_9SPHN|nr:hypothetical protein [Pelagerythrobacter aerophilus]RIV77932.1 hypothetical protein D2V04_08495 [Pelagerythrobacter aerophilus]
MKHYPPLLPRERKPAPPRIPLFYAVPGRTRADGWTPRRQAAFIGYLAETRSVTEAARRVSMARETVYRLRGREGAESFNRAWDAALGIAPAQGDSERSQTGVTPSRKVTNTALMWRVKTGLWQVRMHRGRFVALWQKPDNAALFQLLARLDRAKTSSERAWLEGAAA